MAKGKTGGLIELGRAIYKGLKGGGKKAPVKPPKALNKGNVITKTAKTGAVLGAVGYAGKKLIDIASDLISNLLKGDNNSLSSTFAVRRGKDNTGKIKLSKSQISQSIIFKKHDYPNTYRVQLNQLSNEINYLIKRDKISQRKTDNKYQSIICRKILDKLTLHTEIQNDLIINEIYNVLNVDSEITETTKKNFIGNLIDLITPKNKGNINASFINGNTLKELKSINRTQTKIYLALKELSFASLKNLKHKKVEHSQKSIVPTTSKGGATYISGQSNGGSLLKSLLGLLAGGALLSVFKPFGKDSENEKEENEKEESFIGQVVDAVNNFITQSTPYWRATTANKLSQATRDVGKGVKATSKEVRSAIRTGERILEKGRTVRNLRSSASGLTPNSAIRQRIEEKIKINQKFLDKMKEIFGERLGRVVKKSYHALLKVANTALLGALQVVLVEYEQEHLDEILGRPATDGDRALLYEIALLEAQPFKPLSVAVLILDLAPLILNLGGEVLDLIADLLKYISNKYKQNLNSPIIKQIKADLGTTGACILDALMIDGVDFVISLLKEAGKFLKLIDPNWVINKVAELRRHMVKTAESVHVLDNSLTSYYKDRGLIVRRERSWNTTKNDGLNNLNPVTLLGNVIADIGTGGIGDYTVDWEKVESESIDKIEQMITYPGLDEPSRLRLINIWKDKKLKQIELQKQAKEDPTLDPNSEEAKEKAKKQFELDESTKIETGKSTLTTNIGNLNGYLENSGYNTYKDYYTRQFFESWKYYINEVKENKKVQRTDVKYYLCPPKAIFIQGASNIGPAGDYYIFLYGTVAFLTDPDKPALYSNNLEVLAVLYSNGRFEFSNTPAQQDLESFVHFNSEEAVKITPSRYRINQYESYLGKNSDSNSTLGIVFKNGVSGKKSQSYAKAPTVGSVHSNGVDTSSTYWDLRFDPHMESGPALAYIRSKFSSFDMLFIMQNEMNSVLFKMLLRGELTTSDELPVAYWNNQYQTDFMGNCSLGGFFNKSFKYKPHFKVPGRNYKFESSTGLYTYFAQSVDCAYEWFTHNLSELKRHVKIEKLSKEFKTVVFDIMYHAGAGKFGNKFSILSNALNNEMFLTARNLIATSIDQYDGGRFMEERIRRRVEYLDKVNPKDKQGTQIDTTPPAKGGTPEPPTVPSNGSNANQKGGDPNVTAEPTPVYRQDTGKSTAHIDAADYATTHVRNDGKTGHCAKFVANALEKKGFKFSRQRDAYQYHTSGELQRLGYRMIGYYGGQPGVNDNFIPKKGDICIVNKFETKTSKKPHVSGHMCIYNGKRWVSDFLQPEGNKAWEIYRGTDGKYEVPNRGVWYYRYGKGGDFTGITNAVQNEPDQLMLKSTEIEVKDSITNSKKVQSEVDKSIASSRAKAVSTALHTKPPKAKTENKENEKKQLPTNQLTVYTTAKTNAKAFKDYAISDPNIFFNFAVLDYNEMTWALDEQK